MTEGNTAPQAPDQEGIRSFLSPAAIIVAALVAATTALIRPLVEASTENAVLVAVLISVATTISTAVYKAGVDKITRRGSPGMRRRILLVGLLAGLAACLLGISVVSGVELAVGKEPSISPNGTPIIPYIVGSERSSQPPGPGPGPGPNDGPLISYYFDFDGDGVGAGPLMQYKQGYQPPGWVQRNGDNCPDVPNPDQKNTYGDTRGDACEPRLEPIPEPMPPK